MKLRWYQEKALEALFAFFREHPEPENNPLIAMPTGTGKGVVVAGFCQRVLQRWPGQRILMLTHVQELVQQNADKLRRMWPQVPLGVYSAGLKSKVAHMPITFASVQSVARNLTVFGPQDIILIDECHLVPPDEETLYRRVIEYFRARNPHVRFVGLSATIYRLGLGMLTDGGVFTHVCYDIISLGAFNRLIDEGYLAPLIPMRTSTVLDVSGVHRRGGEFISKELQQAVNIESVTRDAVAEAVEAARERHHWLVFATGIEHAKSIVLHLMDHGIEADVLHSKLARDVRAERLAAFMSGRLRALVNVDILCLDEETEILTSDGFVGIDDMTMQHKIAAWKEDGSVEFAPPVRVVRRQRGADEKMITFGQGRPAQMRVTSNHRMVVYKTSYANSGVAVKQAMQLVGKATQVPCFGDCKPEIITVNTPHGIHTRERMIIANAYNYRRAGLPKNQAKIKATEFVNQKLAMRYACPHELSLDDCSLIGFWLGDGTRSSGRVSITQSLRYADNVAWVDELLFRLGISHARVEYKPTSKIYYKSIRWTLARGTGGSSQARDKGFFYLELYFHKSGTPLFRNLNKEQLNALLDGFWRADGNHHTVGVKHTCVTGTQYDLYNILQSVCVLRGISASILPLVLPKNKKHKQQYRFIWGARQRYCYRKNSIQLEPNYKKERVWCVTSSTSYLICRRRGKVFVTGNTTGFDFEALDCIIVLRPTSSVVLHVQMLGRGTRPVHAAGFDLETVEGRLAASAVAPKRDCLVLDFAGNVMRLGPINDPRIPSKKGEGTGDVPVKVCEHCGCLCHISARTCDNCGEEFDFEVKITGKASTAALIVRDEPQVATFDVDRVTYATHVKPGSPPSLKVSYFCGIQRFSEWVCLEHPSSIRNKARGWWLARAAEPVPQTVAEALRRDNELRTPVQIRVWVNRKYPEVIGYSYERELVQ